MRKNSALLIIVFLLIADFACAQFHLGKSKSELVTFLGTNNTRLTDENGDEVITYINEIKNHPKFGNYTLYSLYMFENDACVMQQNVMPASQSMDIISELNLHYRKVNDRTWHSKENIYYVLSSDKENLRMKIMSEDTYRNGLQ